MHKYFYTLFTATFLAFVVLILLHETSSPNFIRRSDVNPMLKRDIDPETRGHIFIAQWVLLGVSALALFGAIFYHRKHAGYINFSSRMRRGSGFYR